MNAVDADDGDGLTSPSFAAKKEDEDQKALLSCKHHTSYDTMQNA